MTDLERREAIASLPGHLGYQLLLETLNDLVQDAVVLVVNSETEAQTLKASRNLQALFKYFNVLSTVPQNVLTEFEEERKRILDEGEDMIFTPQRRQLLEQIEKTFNAIDGQPKGKKGKT